MNLGDLEPARRTTLLAIAAGADFVKTSTGKISSAATSKLMDANCSMRSPGRRP